MDFWLSHSEENYEFYTIYFNWVKLSHYKAYYKFWMRYT